MIDHFDDVGKGAESIRKNTIWLEAVNENMKQLQKLPALVLFLCSNTILAKTNPLKNLESE
jgi:hypothetical protein